MENLLNRRNVIYGYCAIWIILFHVYRRISMPFIPVLTNVIGIGNMAVDIFILFSGICLTISSEKHKYDEIKGGWKYFYLSRLRRIIPPYLIICLPYYIYQSVIEVSGGTIKKIMSFFANFSSATFWLKGTQTTWYVYGIAFLYLIFPALYLLIKRGNKKTNIVLLGISLGFAFFSAYVPILKNALVIWARIPIFIIGILLVKSNCDFFNHVRSRKAIVFSAITLLCIGGFISFDEIFGIFHIPQNARLLLYIPCVLATIVLINNINDSCDLKILKIVGGISLEVYLIHITLLHPLKFFGILDCMGYLTYIALPIVSIALSLLVQKIENLFFKGK